MKLGKYYIDYNKNLGEDFSDYKFDSNGIPLVQFHNNSKWQYNPVTVSQFGLHHFNLFLKSHSENCKKKFLAQADWLIKNGVKGKNNSLVWHYSINIPFYEIKAPWISGMAQGEAISLLIRAYQTTNNSEYLSAAKQAFKILNVSVHEGGVLSKFPDGSLLIEEYPSKYLSGVLNGFIFAIFGIYDYSLITQDQDSFNLFLDVINSLKKNLSFYDSGFWSYYDLKSPLRLTSQAYHRLHIEQLKQIFHITNDLIFDAYQKRWENYTHSKKCKIKWFLKKVHQKIIR